MADGPRKTSIAELRSQIRAASFEDLPALLHACEDDPRKQVSQLVQTAWKRYGREEKERHRVLDMYATMRSLGGDGVVLGLDEVGRGPLAGPLTVAAVALPIEPVVWGINDSKQLSPEMRETLASQILTHAVAVGIAHVEPLEIDACGMSACLRKAMLAAIDDSAVDPDAVLIDGVPLHIHPKETTIVKGDAKVACIAAASIVAKVTRDAIMVAADRLYPGYGFAQNKGYGSADHIEAIARLGLSPLHRRSFCTHFAQGTLGD